MSAFIPVTGGGIVQFYVLPTVTWTINNYVGLGPDGPSATASLVLPWIAPAKGRIDLLAVQGNERQTTGGTIYITLYKAASSITPTYEATSVSAAVLNSAGNGSSDPAASFDVVQGDMVLAFITGTWPGGQTMSARWTVTP